MSLELTDSHPVDRAEEILTGDALGFVESLHHRFAARRDELLAARTNRREQVARAGTMNFLAETADVRTNEWTVAPAPPALQDRRVEMTGPATPAKMAINALNSGAKVWLADLEDASCPTWPNVIDAILNLRDGARGNLAFSVDGKDYRLRTDAPLAVVVARPRGWHLPEAHILIDGERGIGALVDFGLHFFHLAKPLMDNGHGPYYYLPKLESHLEARLWNDIFTFAEAELAIPYGTIRATVLIETIPAAFEMEEILYELRDHASGLNAGRWDYLFSIIKYFRDAGPDFVLVDRSDITMTAPFMRAYTELLVKTCHRRGAFAMGGMAALIPSRRDAEANQRAIDAVRADKRREAEAGFDGTWVAHPDVVGVALEEFDRVLGDRPNQIDRQRPDVSVAAEQLLDAASTPGEITEAGLRSDVNVGFQYISFWLGGRGAAGINNLMEDAATAEISRSQIWQWIRHGRVTRERVREVLDEEMARIRADVGDEVWAKGRPDDTRAVFERVALGEDFPEFLTLPAYELLD